jgi:hypothetical protein
MMPALGWFALPGSPIPATAAENFFLRRLHSARAGLRSIIESVQMQKTMNYVQLKLPQERVSKRASVSFSRLNADKNFTVLKC